MKNSAPKSNKIKITIVAVGGKAASQFSFMEWTKDLGVRRVAIVPNGSEMFLQPGIADALISLPLDRRVAAAKRRADWVDIAQSVVTAKMDEIERAIADADLVFFRGNISSALVAEEISVIASRVRAEGKLAVYAYALPFSFEGAQPMALARAHEATLRGSVDAMVPVDSDALVLPGMTAAQALGTVGNYIGEFTRACLQMIETCGTINIDWNDIRSTVHNAQRVHVGSAVGSVSDSAEALVEKAFSVKPGFGETQRAGFERAVYVISAGADVPAQTVHDLGCSIESRLATDARIIFGVEESGVKEGGIEVRVVAAGI